MIPAFDPDADAAPPRPPSGVGFVVAASAMLALLVMMGFWLIGSERAAIRERDLVRASYERRLTSADLLLQLHRVETAQRGFVLTGDASFFRPYRPARAALLDRASRLEVLYAADPIQARRIARLRAIIDAKIVEMERVLTRRNASGASAAIGLIAQGRGRMLMEEAVAIGTAINTAEDRRLAGVIAADERCNANASRTMIALLGVAILVTLAAMAVAWRSRLTRYQWEARAHEGLSRLHAIFASTAEALVTLDSTGRIEGANAAAARMLGYEQARLIGHDVGQVLDIAPGEGAFADRLGIVGGRLDRPSRTGMTAHGRNGREIPVDVMIGLMPLADGVHVVVSIRDISERRAAERLKDEFISTVSHELRTPLTSVVGSLGLLRGGPPGSLSDQARRLVEIAENNARRLIRLINDILDIDRIGVGRSPLATAMCDLRVLGVRGADDAQGLAISKSIALETELAEERVPVLADLDRLLQVIGNLLSNAIRFSPEGGQVTLTVLRRDDKAVLAIDDSGPGVAPEFRDRIFGRFTQSAAGAAIPGGTGLGLAISREIVKAHEGDIWFEDAPAGGARFCIALPLYATASSDIPATAPTILVCEDDPDAAEVLRGLIEARGYGVTLCGTAREVQALAQSGRFAGVVLDLVLPDASGLGAIRALRAVPKTRDLPIVVVSAFARDNGTSATAHALDVIDWIDKPVDPARLLDALDRAIRHHDDGRPTLLHVDDDLDMLEVTALALADRGRVLKATTLAEARALLIETMPDIVILDLNLPDGNGIELLPDLFAADGMAIPTIIYSASETVPEMARQVDAALVKSRRSLLSLSETIGDLLDKRRAR